MNTKKISNHVVFTKYVAFFIAAFIVLALAGCTNSQSTEIKIDIIGKNENPTKETNNSANSSNTQKSSDNTNTNSNVRLNENNEPEFPKPVKVTQWLMFGYSPNNLANVDADIKLPLGKIADSSNPDKSEYRMVSFMAPQKNRIFGNPVVVDDKIYFGCEIGYLQCMNFKTSEPIWRNNEPMAPVTSSLATDGNLVICGTADGILHAYDTKTQAEKWTFQTGKNISAPPGSTDEGMTNGRIHGGPKFLDKKIFFGAFDGKLYCLEALTGSKVWEFQTKSKIYSSPAIYENKIYFSNFEGRIFCLEQSSGKKVWESKLEKTTVASPVVFGQRLWVGDKKGKMYCMSTVDGKILWSYQGPDSDYGIEATPALDENNLYYGDSSGSMMALNRINGAQIWKVQLNKSDIKPSPSINSSPVLVRDKIIVGGHSGRLFIIEKYSGKVLDQFDCGGSILSQPVIIGNEILATSWDSVIYILREKGSKNPYK